MILSLIIPIYNVEPFIDQCLGSVYAQNWDETLFEVVSVNDGTLDHSMDIVQRYAEGHSNLHIVNQKNQGLSVARNMGLSHAKGEYVWFVDSDDWLTDDAFATVMAIVREHPDVDVFATILMMQYEKTGRAEVEYTPNPMVRSGRDYMFRNHNANRGACQRYIFKKAFLEKHDLKFMPGVYHEDGEFSNRMLYLADKLLIIPQPVYNYRIRTSGSIMSSRKMKMNDDLVKIFYSLKEFAEQYVKGNADYWPYRVKVFQCLAETVLFSRNEIFTKDFDSFYQRNKRLIKHEARAVLLHASEVSGSDVAYLLKFALCPKLETQLRQAVKRMLKRLKIYK